MGGLCGSGSNNNSESGLMTKLKTMAFSMMVKSGGGEGNNSQFDMLKNMVTKQYPKANITQEVDPSLGDGKFDVMLEGEKIHSKEKDGDIQNSSVMNSIKEMLMKKVKSLL